MIILLEEFADFEIVVRLKKTTILTTNMLIIGMKKSKSIEVFCVTTMC